ncbi:Myb-like_DNA-binding domain-containing protein [Hexamita inflata]|uniref:Myb-like DNA-binding domain-containing protein n=1 Tax=Hexamita inflata TaxID=28002 RepID=A0AA86U776_9EUKA|nr:Myb-like DNA-binding domain-containing protein [Hexamita inflata]CAI9965031.1 Myb-like DNA-binding domain-containing protein [Hexamita inflata]
MRQQWQSSEKQLLCTLVAENTQNARVNWKNVASAFDNRTPTQCKLQFRNVLQTCPRVNFVWSEQIEFELFVLVKFFGKKWTFLQQNYFSDLNPEQIRVKFYELNRKQQLQCEFERKNGADFEEKVVQMALGRIQGSGNAETQERILTDVLMQIQRKKE